MQYTSLMKIGIVGASGYAGGELLRYLRNHPHAELSYIGANTQAGEAITSVHPALTFLHGLKFAAFDITAINNCDLVFLALPHGESAKMFSQLRNDLPVVDLGADFRLKNPFSWEKYYGGEHAGYFTYGMPDLLGHSDAIAQSKRVANPGCYATAITLSAAPAVHGGVINNSDITVVAASGTTGAGRSAKINLIASEVMNSLTSYKFGGAHQHTPEIEEALDSIKNPQLNNSKISFTPILAPMPRGILATTTAQLVNSYSTQEIRDLYRDFYIESPFVTVLDEGQMPQTSAVYGSNHLHLQVAVDTHTNRLIISAAIDNLGKGAAGQAIENANIMMGFNRSAGLTQWGVR